MKTEFELDFHSANLIGSKIFLIGKEPKDKPYVSISVTTGGYLFVKDKDLEKLAVNILKAIRSKKLNAPKT